MRNLASVQKVVSVTPIENADRVEKIGVLGWEVVCAKKDNFKVGDKVVYVEIDSILPPKPEFEFLKERKYRVRTIKLRGVVSQGLILPMSVLPKGVYHYSVGDDVTEVLGIRKYDPQAEAEEKLVAEKEAREKSRIKKFLMRNAWYRKFFLPKPSKSFPEFIKKTDEERIQKLPHLLSDQVNLYTFTEKVDGQSATYFLIRNPNKWQFWKKYIFGVCSRNIYLAKEDNSSYWTIARELEIKDALKWITFVLEDEYSQTVDKLILQGEIIGPNIQGNKYKVSEYKFFAFNLIVNDRKLPYHAMTTFLNEIGIDCVPFVGLKKLPPTVPEIVELAKGKSKLYDTEREGIVVRKEGVSFKVISPDFLLKYEE